MPHLSSLFYKAVQILDSPVVAWHRFINPKYVSFKLASALYKFAKSQDGSKVDTIIDVGANEGQFAYMARLAWPSARIQSFEPFIPACAKFREKHSKDKNVILHTVGLGEVKTALPFFTGNNSANNSLRRSLTESQATAEMVNIIPLDDVTLAKGTGDILMKIDVQGAEDSVLKGGIKTSADIKYILIEVSLKPMYESGPEIDALWSQLRKAGFTYHSIMDEYRDPETQIIVQLDVLFVRKG